MLVIAHFKLYLTEGLNIHQVENDSCDFLYVCRINLVNQLNLFFIFLFKFFRVFFHMASSTGCSCELLSWCVQLASEGS